MNVNNPSHAIGVISTPNAGGMTPLTARNKGSVGMTRRTQGKSVDFVVGYHERTTRANMAKDMRFNKGSRKVAAGCTHASVSAIKREDAEAASTRNEGSTTAERAELLLAVKDDRLVAMGANAETHDIIARKVN